MKRSQNIILNVKFRFFFTAFFALFIFTNYSIAKEKIHFRGTVPLKNKNEKEYTHLARVSVKDAIAETNKSVKGDVTTVRLDQRNGFLVYVVEVDDNKPGSYLQEALIDAGSGQLLSLETLK